MKKEELMQRLKQQKQDSSYSSYVAVANILDQMSMTESELSPFRVAVLRNFTFDPLLAILKAEIAQLGFFPKVYLGEHDTVAADVMNSESAFYSSQPDCVILAQWLEGLAPRLVQRFGSLSEKEVSDEVEHVLNTLVNQVSHIREHLKAPVLVNNFPLPYPVSFGILDAQAENMQVNSIRRLNQEMLRRLKEYKDVYLVDYAYLMGSVGYQNGFDERYWHLGKAPISRYALIPFGLAYVRFLRALSGKVHKCLILDCDNSLWGGTVGEDGLNGIQLGSTYPGSCYMAFQNEILNLHDRGIILALCSRNNERDVLEVLRDHPYMMIREKHLATWQINWEDKATNIRRIVEQLNIGMDSVVFADDSDYEIGFVKHQIPEITTIKLSSHPSQLKSLLIQGAYFDSLSFSQEDRKRNKMYKDEVARKKIGEKTSSIEEYLFELQITASIKKPDDFYIPRVSQLTQKTNQFNLTTKRYTEGDIERFIKALDWDIWYLQLKDKISDMGVVGVAIIRNRKTFAEIDSFLLSCRVLGRGVEDAFLAYVIKQVQQKGLASLKGHYIPTRKNGQVANFYQRHGFANTSTTKEASEWELNLKDFTCNLSTWIQIVSN